VLPLGTIRDRGCSPLEPLPVQHLYDPELPLSVLDFFPTARALASPLLSHGDASEPAFLHFFLFGSALKFLTSRDTFPCNFPSPLVAGVPPPRHFRHHGEHCCRRPPRVSARAPLAMKQCRHAALVTVVFTDWLPHRRQLRSAGPLPMPKPVNRGRNRLVAGLV
jgi:hypothetical protein